MGYKTRGLYSIPVCLGCCECISCRKKRESVRNISKNNKSCARNGQKYGVDNPRKLDIEDTLRLSQPKKELKRGKQT